MGTALIEERDRFLRLIGHTQAELEAAVAATQFGDGTQAICIGFISDAFSDLRDNTETQMNIDIQDEADSPDRDEEYLYWRAS